MYDRLTTCGEFPVTWSLADLKGQISYHFMSSLVQREIWPVFQWVKIDGKVLEYLNTLFYFGDLLLPQGSKGSDGNREARGWDPRRVCAAEDQKWAVAKAEPK